MCRRLHALGLALLFASPMAWAQPTCRDVSLDYDGPCPYGLLPAFFDDFTYESAGMVENPESLPVNDLFGANRWTYEGEERIERGWFRYSQHDLALPGHITFETPSVLRAVLPRGLAAEDYARSMSFFSRPLMKAGTYAWRARLSDLARGTRVRQALWAMSPTAYVFESTSAEGPSRYRYWSELDFENENHFRGENRDGTFYPDFVTRMSVGNHFGKLLSPQGTRRLSESGIVEWTDGSGVLARNGAATTAAVEEAPLVSWADEWVYFMLDVNDRHETVTFRMVPESTEGRLLAVAERSIVVGPDFYPRDVMHIVISLHWLEAEGRLGDTLWLESDWVYYSPVEDLSVAAVLEQVDAFRTRAIERANTTGNRPVSLPHLELEIAGPDRAACGRVSQWITSTDSPGLHFVTARYRLVPALGQPGPWQGVNTRTISVEPRRQHRTIEIEATAQELWGAYGTVERNGWKYPNPRNAKVEARHVIPVDCDPW